MILQHLFGTEHLVAFAALRSFGYNLLTDISAHMIIITQLGTENLIAFITFIVHYIIYIFYALYKVL